MYKSKLILLAVVASLLMLGLSGCAGRVDPNRLSRGLKVSKEVKVPTDVELSIYIPKNMQEAEFFMKYSGYRVEPGRALKEAVMSVSDNFFPAVSLFDTTKPKQFGLLLDIQPEWDFEYGKVILTLDYRVLDTNQNVLLEASVTEKSSRDYNDPTGAFYNAAVRSSQKVIVKILNALKPSAEKFAATNSTSSLNFSQLANMDKPVSTGTAFWINGKGNLVTAAHVINNCLVLKAKDGDKIFDVNIDKTSQLLDVAVLKTEKTSRNYLKFRLHSDFVLGEKVLTVSYPLNGLLDASPNLTFGNVSSKKALSGSLGLFQFSAPIQPGSSGGAVVSEQGEILGIVSSTLRANSLAEKGIIPQNINFALENKFIRKFLTKNQVAYHTLKRSRKNAVGTELASKATVQLSCYQ
ncbi:S1 family peptidase [Pleionea sediminis]|uniref:S1 family peptidase n=1 Tax=Pleionea sediminis TaxID=2569479 RepID=UPI001186E6EB|nr:serine protease [Pleionea sediminis]